MRILLCCAAGMSTSLLVANMEKEAKNSGEDHEIWAVSADEATKQIENADVLLLGPQVRYLLPSLKKLGEEKNIPVDAINPVHYGTVNGKEVLKYAKEFTQAFSDK